MEKLNSGLFQTKFYVLIYFAEITSISKTKGEYPGILEPEPFEPYPNADGKISVVFSPIFIFAIPSSKPVIAPPDPKTKEKLPASNCLSVNNLPA